jgi:hypothetical protein
MPILSGRVLSNDTLLVPVATTTPFTNNLTVVPDLVTAMYFHVPVVMFDPFGSCTNTVAPIVNAIEVPVLRQNSCHEPETALLHLLTNMRVDTSALKFTHVSMVKSPAPRLS